MGKRMDALLDKKIRSNYDQLTTLYQQVQDAHTRMIVSCQSPDTEVTSKYETCLDLAFRGSFTVQMMDEFLGTPAVTAAYRPGAEQMRRSTAESFDALLPYVAQLFGVTAEGFMVDLRWIQDAMSRGQSSYPEILIAASIRVFDPKTLSAEE